MTKAVVMFSSILLLFGTLLLVPSIGPAHAQTTGTVCIIPSGTTSCPSSPASITGVVGSQLRVSVFIQNSQALNAFDITLLADHTIIQPSSVDLTGSVMEAAAAAQGGFVLVLANCMGGIGSGCNSALDTADTIQESAVCEACMTSTPTTGLLFTAIYNVVASSNNTPIKYQTGCSASSVSGTTTCVGIANAGTIVPENVQTAVFSTPPDFAMTARPATLNIQRNSQATSTITLTSLNGFAGTVTLSASLSPVTSHSPSTSLSPPSVALTSGSSATALLTVSTVKNTTFGSFMVMITGTSSTTTHTVTVTVTVTHRTPASVLNPTSFFSDQFIQHRH